MMNTCYLDNAAMSPISKEINDRLPSLLEGFYNPSSSYQLARNNLAEIENVRQKIADMINADPDEIIFTSCASESNALAMNAFNTVFCSPFEHSSISESKAIRFENEEKLFDWLSDNKDYENGLYCQMIANNETGHIYDIKNISKFIHGKKMYIHVDATAMFGKYLIDVKKLNIDYMSAAFQKIGGIVGCAFLYVKNGVPLKPLICGSQNNGRRGGTYNYLAIACAGIVLNSNKYFGIDIIKKCDYFVNRLYEIGIKVNFQKYRKPILVESFMPNIISACVPQIENRELISLLDNWGIMVSSGSACNSGNNEPSKVLLSYDLTEEEAKHTIRISFDDSITYAVIDEFISILKAVLDTCRLKGNI